MAVGGTLPVKLSYNYGTYIYKLFSGKELHDAMGYSDNTTVINANGSNNPAAKYQDNVEYAIDEIAVPTDFVLGEGFDGDGGPFILEVNGVEGQVQITSSTAYGATPQALVMGKYTQTTSTTTSTSIKTTTTIYGFRWPKENVNIKTAYPGITTWMSNPNDISFLASGVDSKLYDGYDPTETHTYTTPLGLEPVDLDLPSGTLWANMNVGASNPKDFGDYYAWGETLANKTDYNDVTYIYSSGDDNNLDGYYESYGTWTFDDLGVIAGTEYDVAHVKWGGNWTMPTYLQFYELIDRCVLSWETVDGVECMKFTGNNGKYIYLPAAGYRIDKDLIGDVGLYWTATPMGSSHSGCSYFGYISNSRARLDVTVGDYNTRLGMSVRPVISGSGN